MKSQHRVVSGVVSESCAVWSNGDRFETVSEGAPPAQAARVIGKVSSCGALGDVLYPYAHSPSRFSRTSELAQKARARRFFSSRGFAAASTGWCSGESRSQLRQNRGHLDVCACNSEPGFRGRHDGLGRNDTRPGSLACRPAQLDSRLLCLLLPARIPASSRAPYRSDALRPSVGAAPHEFRLRPNLAHFRLHATATRFLRDLPISHLARNAAGPAPRASPQCL